MNLPFQQQIDQIKSWPRAAQVALLLACVLVGWLLVRDSTWAWAASYSKEAAELRTLAARERDQSQNQVRMIRDQIIAHGQVQAPRRASEGAAQMAAAATRIIRQHSSVINFKYDARTSQRLPASALRDVVGNRRAERVTADVQFEAPVEVVSKIVSELEASPDIDSVSTLRLQRVDPGRRLRVKMIIEAWVVAGDEPGRRTT